MDPKSATPTHPILVPDEPPHIRVELYSQPRYLSGARDLVAAVARRFGFDESACGQIALAVDEALCNIIRHGYDRRTDGRIWVMIWPTHDRAGAAAADVTDPTQAANPAADAPHTTTNNPNLPKPCCHDTQPHHTDPRPANPADPAGILIVIDDQAKQVDPAIIRSRDLEDVRPGGLGVFIIQSVMDAVEYRHRPNGGMRLVMTKASDPEALRRQHLEDPDAEILSQDPHAPRWDHANDPRDPERSRGHADGAPAGQERP